MKNNYKSKKLIRSEIIDVLINKDFSKDELEIFLVMLKSIKK